MAAKRTRSKPEPAPLLERTPLLEWITAILGLALALGAIGFLIWEGLNAGEGSPVLAARVGAITPTPYGYVVDVDVRNRTRVTASAVQVEGVLTPKAGPKEVVTLTFDYVPGLGRREGSMTFQSDPRGENLTLQVKGQVSP